MFVKSIESECGTMFRTVAELVDIAERENLTIAEIMINREMNISGLPREEITAAMERN